MAIKVPVPVLWDSDRNFLNSALVNVDGSSVVVGTFQKATKPYPPGSTPVLQNTLQIKDPNFGTLWLNMTLVAYQAALRSLSVSSAPAVTTAIIHVTAGTAGSTLTVPALTGATIVSIWKNGSEQDLTTIIFSGGDNLTFPSPLANGDTVGILYYLN